jgi:hypothetical protein
MWLTNMKATLATCKDDIFPPGAANNWWITASSPFARMLAVLFAPTSRVEQNAELVVRLLFHERHCRSLLPFHPPVDVMDLEEKFLCLHCCTREFIKRSVVTGTGFILWFVQD